MAAEAPASPGGGSHESGEQSPRSNVREQDRYLPIANISRIMKKALPANGKIAKDAKETVQECVSEFISFITSEASDKCQREKRKTINGDDLLWAMATLGFEDYIDPLKIYLTRYREGDTKGNAKGGDASAKKDGQPNPNTQLAHQGSFPQGVNYGNSQGQRILGDTLNFCDISHCACITYDLVSDILKLDVDPLNKGMLVGLGIMALVKDFEDMLFVDYLDFRLLSTCKGLEL
ncbi:nuclear transcription factor Y subunit B-10 [Citrus sinensis]|nr:nuclear transcription factor Y subunit B-10 [Citrus sinensis]